MFPLLLLACAPDPEGQDAPPDRLDGDRTPIATSCDPLDEGRCWLPWPSSAQTVLDASRPTGLRVEVDESQLPIADDPQWLELADGFSRVSPALTSVAGALDPASASHAVRFFVSYVDGAPAATEVPAWSEGVVDGARTLVIGYPNAVLPPNADIVVVVSNDLTLADGGAPVNEPLDRIALGLDAPVTADDAAVAAWYAPIRRTLDDAGVDPATVFRAWSFTTRSIDDPALRMRAMIADVDASSLSVTISSVEVPGDGPIAMIVRGTVDGVPAYRPNDDGWIVVDDGGRPVQQATHAAPFRVVVPAGTGDYPALLYGHGTGGDVGDSSFDTEIAERGIAKAGMQFWGWNGEELITLITYLSHVFDGATRSTCALMQSLADGRAIVRAMPGPLGDALAAETIAGVPNPAAGRRPIDQAPMWVGGSLGGTMGAVMVAADPDITVGIVNVPASAWTHLIPRASLYTMLAEPITHAWYPTDLDARAALAMSQNAWDDADGAAWDDPGALLLIQESIGDPVVPNVGTAMLARARGAAVVGGTFDDMLDMLEQTDGVTGRTGVTQYLTPYTDDYDIHGFAAKDGPVGDAAREQMEAFLQAWRSGEPPPIQVPSGCEPAGICDFSE